MLSDDHPLPAYRLCLVCISLRAGGTERVVSKVANHLSQKHAVSILLLSRTTPFYKACSNVSILRPQLERRSEAGWRWYPRMLGYLWQSLRSSDPDLVLCFGEPIAPSVLSVARAQGRRVMVFNRASPLTSLRGKRGLLNPFTYPLAARVVVQTQHAIDLMQARYRFCRFGVLPNPIDIPDRVPPMAQRHRRVINIGTLGGKKNQKELIRIFASIESQTEWTLDLVGDGPDRKALEQLIQTLELKESVRLLGRQSNVDALLHDSSIFAFTSLTEGFPNALAEAMAAGCACISYDCPTGPSELIEHGVDGFLVDPGDEAEYRRLLQRLIDEPDLREKFSRNARESMKRFEAGTVMGRLEDMIGEAIDKKQAQGARIKDQGKQ